MKHFNACGGDTVWAKRLRKANKNLKNDANRTLVK
jgi:hypothetical protein